MANQEQSVVSREKATRKTPLYVAASSEAVFTDFRKMEIKLSQHYLYGGEFHLHHLHQLIMFHDRFHGNEPHKGHLQVRLIRGEVYCKVEFRDTRDTDGNNNLLSTLYPSNDFQVSHLFKLLSEIDWKNRIFYCGLLPCSPHNRRY